MAEEERNEAVASEESPEEEVKAPSEEVAQEDVGSEVEDKGQPSESEEESGKDAVTPPSEVEKLKRELANVNELYGKQTNEIGELRQKVDSYGKPAPVKEEVAKELTDDELITQIATKPKEFVNSIKKALKAEMSVESEDAKLLDKVNKEYPEMKNKDSSLYKKAVEVVQRNPRAYQSKASLIEAARMAKLELGQTNPEEIKKEAVRETKKNIYQAQKENKSGDAPRDTKGGKKSIVEAAGLDDKQAKRLQDMLGDIPLSALDEDINFDSAKKRREGKK